MSHEPLSKKLIFVFEESPVASPPDVADWLHAVTNDTYFCHTESAALAYLADTRPDLIIINSENLPHELLNYCQTQSLELPILALLPAKDALIEQALTLGLTDCLTAPILPSLFKATLKKLLNHLQNPPAQFKSTQTYENLVEQSHTVIMVVDKEGHLVFINRYGALALQNEDLTRSVPIHGTQLSDILPPDLAAIYAEKSKQVIHTQIADTHEYLGRGGHNWFITSIYPITFNDEMRCAAIVAYDITAYKQAQLELDQHKIFYQLMYEKAALGIIVGTFDGIITQVNDTFANMLGYTPEELTGVSAEIIMPPQDPPLTDQIRERMTGHNNDTLIFEKTYLHKDGHIIWVEIAASSLERPDTHTRHLILFIKNISEQKAYETAFKQESKRFEAVFEQAAVGMTLTSLDRRLTRVNQRFCEIIGYTEDELIGRNVNEFIHPDDLDEDLQHTENLIHSQSATYTAEKRYLHKDGRIVWVNVSISVLLSENNIPESFIALAEDITRHKIAIETVRQNEARLRQIMEIAQIGIWEWNASDNITRWQGDMFRIYGISPEEFTGDNDFYLEYMHPDDLEANRLHMEENLARAPHISDLSDEFDYVPHNFEPNPIELRVQRTDGSLRYVLGDSIFLLDDNENIVRRLGFVLDITDQKLAEATLSQKNQELEALLEIAREVGSTRDLHEVLDALLDQLEKLVPYTSASIALVSDDHVEYIAGRGLPANISLEDLSTVLTNEKIWLKYHRYEVVIVDDVTQDPHWVELPDVDNYFHSWMGVPIIYRDRLIGQLNIDHAEIGYFKEEHARLGLAVANQVAIAIENAQLFADLEKRVKARTAELRLQTKQTEAILVNMTDAVIMFNENGTILYSNLAWQRMHEYTPDGEIPDNIRAFQHDQPADGIMYQEMWRALRRGENWRGNLRYKINANQSFELDIVVVAVTNNEEDVYVAVLRDISEQRKLDNMKTQFIADVAHDLSNPLAVMTLKTYLIKAQPHELDRHLPVLEQQIERLNALVEDLLVVSRLDRRVISFKPKPSQVNHIVQNVVVSQTDLAARKQITLHSELSEGLPLIHVDVDQLQRVIVNLVANALNYTPVRGQIWIKTFRQENQVVIVVKDTGIGISSEEQARIFDRFFRGSKSANIADGTGLGLSIVLEILNLHHASIEVDSEPSVGSEFRLYFNIDESFENE